MLAPYHNQRVHNKRDKKRNVHIYFGEFYTTAINVCRYNTRTFLSLRHTQIIAESH